MTFLLQRPRKLYNMTVHAQPLAQAAMSWITLIGSAMARLYVDGIFLLIRIATPVQCSR